MYKRSFCFVLDETGKNVIGTTGRIRIKDPCSVCGSYHEARVKCRSDGGPRPYPKWKHSRFSTTKVLYNSWNIPFGTTSILLTEGPKDVWVADQNGIFNSTCVLGSNLYPYHIDRIESMGINKVFVMMDNDEAGVEARDKIMKKLNKRFETIDCTDILKKGCDPADMSKEEWKTLHERMKNSD
jgi:DNA primase